MVSLKFQASLVVLSVLLSAPAFAGVTCSRGDNGRYTWGESPAGCDAQPLGDVSKVANVYGSFTFDRRKSGNKPHLQAYMTNMNALIRDMATDYLKRREPGSSQATIDSFVRAIQSVANQESYWSHYRWATDGRLKLMVGDLGKSQGMMQLHDSSLAARNRLSRFDLATNLLMGIEQYYIGWSSARRASCVAGLTGTARLNAQAKAAYAAYNGGPGAICRWTNHDAKWSRNDTGYWEKFAGRPWAKFVTDEKQKLPVDLECLKAGRSTCEGRTNQPPEQPVTPTTNASLAGHVINLEDGRQCFSADGRSLHCAPDLRTLSCLEAYVPATATMPVLKFKASADALKGLEWKAYASRDELCAAGVKDLAVSGNFVQMKDDADLLDKVNGAPVAKAKAGDVFQVVDYEVSGKGQNLQYRVAMKDGKFAWIQAGETSARRMTITTDAAAIKTARKVLPVAGDKIVIKRSGGINLRKEASTSSQVLTAIAEKQTVTVKAVKSLGGSGERWLSVEVDGQKGMMYSGHVSPEPDVDLWIAVGM